MSRIFSEYPYVDYENFNLDWILKKMKECIQRYHDNEEAIDALQVELQDLREYVDHYFDSQDFEALIRQVLDEMEDDGTLERIINEEIFEGLNDKIDHKLPDAAFRNVGVIPYGYFINNKRVNLGYNIHAGAICADGQTQYIIGNDFANNAEGLGIFRTISIQSNKDYIDTIRTAKVGHANSICVYNDNELLMAPVRLGTNDPSNYVSKVYVLSRAGAVLREITTPDWVRSVTRDPLSGKIYVLLADRVLYEINPENDYLTLVKDINPIMTSAYDQDVAMYNGILYCTSQAGDICAIDVENEYVLWSGKVDCVVTNGNINAHMGELDGMEFTDSGNLLCLFDQRDSDNRQFVGFVCEILVGTAKSAYSFTQDALVASGSTLSTYSRVNTRIYPSRTQLGFARDVKDFDIISLVEPRYQNVEVNESYTSTERVILPPWITALRLGSNVTLDVDQIQFLNPEIRINVPSGATLKLNKNLLVPIGARILLDGTGTIAAESPTELTDLTGNYRHGRIVSVDPRLTFTNVLLDGEAITAGTHIYNLVS